MGDTHKEAKRVDGDSVLDARRIFLIGRSDPGDESTATDPGTITLLAVEGVDPAKQASGRINMGAGKGVRIRTGAMTDNTQQVAAGSTNGVEAVVGITQKIDLLALPETRLTMDTTSVTVKVNAAGTITLNVNDVTTVEMTATQLQLKAGASSITMNATSITLSSGANSIELGPAGITIQGTPLVNIN